MNADYLSRINTEENIKPKEQDKEAKIINSVYSDNVYEILSSKDIPWPTNEMQVEGIVFVSITLDRSGNVINATPGTKGSTTFSSRAYFLVREQ